MIKKEKDVSEELLDDIQKELKGEEVASEWKDELVNVEAILKYAPEIERLHKKGLFGKPFAFTLECGELAVPMNAIVSRYLSKNVGDGGRDSRGAKIKKRTTLFTVLCWLFVKAWESLDEVTREYYKREFGESFERIYVELKKVFEKD